LRWFVLDPNLAEPHDGKNDCAAADPRVSSRTGLWCRHPHLGLAAQMMRTSEPLPWSESSLDLAKQIGVAGRPPVAILVLAKDRERVAGAPHRRATRRCDRNCDVVAQVSDVAE